MGGPFRAGVPYKKTNPNTGEPTRPEPEGHGPRRQDGHRPGRLAVAVREAKPLPRASALYPKRGLRATTTDTTKTSTVSRTGARPWGGLVYFLTG